MSKITIIRQGVLDIMPLAIAVIPWGILSGAMAINIGFSFWQAQAMSMFVFAGAAQLSAMTLISTGANWFSISSSVFTISSRHILYSIDLRREVYNLPFKTKVALAFFLTDEMYAITKLYIRKNGVFSLLYSLSAGIAFYLFWNLSTYVGIIAGKNIENLASYGLDFAVVAVFVAITAEHLRDFPMLITTVVSAISTVYFKMIFPDSYIVIASILGMTAGYIVKTRFK